MTEIILLSVIVSLIALLAFEKHQNRKERSKYLNAIIAKDTTDMLNLEVADKTKVEVNKAPKGDSDVVPLGSLSSEQFDKFIEEQNG